MTRLVALLDSNDPYTLRAAARAVEWLAAYEGGDAHSLMQRPKLRDGLLRLLDPDKCSRVQRAGGKSAGCVAAWPSHAWQVQTAVNPVCTCCPFG